MLGDTLCQERELQGYRDTLQRGQPSGGVIAALATCKAVTTRADVANIMAELKTSLDVRFMCMHKGEAPDERYQLYLVYTLPGGQEDNEPDLFKGIVRVRQQPKSLPATLPTPTPGELVRDYQRHILELWHLEVDRLQAMINEVVDRKARRERADARALARKRAADAEHSTGSPTHRILPALMMVLSSQGGPVFGHWRYRLCVDSFLHSQECSQQQ